MNTKNLIIGAGLAGTSCAHELASAGQQVLVLEQRDLSTKAKLCAGLLTPRAQSELTRIYGLDAVRVIAQRFESMRTLAGRHDVMLSDTPLVCTDRKILDSFCVEAARDRGAQFIDSFTIESIDTRNKRLQGYRPGEKLIDVSYENLIVADGALSPMRKRLTGSAPDSVLTLEARVENNGTPVTFAYLDGFFGYFWYAPCGDHAKIGCGSYGGDELEEPLYRFAEEIGVSIDKLRGAYIPTGRDVLLHTDDAWFLGDAASLVCPPSGEGIFFAMRSGRMCARALISHANYEALMRPCAQQIRREFMTRGLFFNAGFIDRSLTAAGCTPYGKERAIKFALRNFASFS